MLRQDDVHVSGIGVPQAATWVPGRVSGVGFAGAGVALELLGPYIERAKKAIGDFLFGTSYDAFADFVNAVARSDANVEPGANTVETITRCLAAGIVPIYCSDSEGTRNNIIREFKARGWNGKPWGQRYAKGGGSYTWWYGVILRTADAPAATVARAQAAAAPDLQAAMTKTVKLCVDAKHRMRTYGGDENYDAMIVEAVPVLPAVTETTRPAPDAVTFRPSPFTTPPGTGPTAPPPAVSPPEPPGPASSPVVMERLLSLVETLALRRSLAGRGVGGRGVKNIL